MLGRWFRVKKTWLFRVFAGFLFLCFIALTVLSFVLFKIPDLWFYSFCICVGALELIESFMFNFDSAFYFGSLLSLIGAFGYVYAFLNLRKYAIFFVAIAFIFASLVTTLRFKQKFHLVIAYSILFPTIFGFLFATNLITLPIFIAFCSAFLVLLLLGIITSLKGEK